jgi:transcriptional regulator with XRE-family HTH domain
MMSSKTITARVNRIFSARLREKRKMCGYKSAESFATAVGMKPHTYRRYERGTAQPSLVVLARICMELDVTPNDILPEPKTVWHEDGSPVLAAA